MKSESSYKHFIRMNFALLITCLLQMESAYAGALIDPRASLSNNGFAYNFEEPVTEPFGYISHYNYRSPIALNPENDAEVLEVSEHLFKDIALAHDLRALQNLLGIKEIDTNTVLADPERDFNGHQLKISSRSGKKDKFLDNPSEAHCEPEMKSVELGLTSSTDVAYYPTCIRVKRCGGCCHNKEISSCQPTDASKVIVKVLELTPSAPQSNDVAPRRNRRRGSIVVQYKSINVTVEEHTKCQCMCILKERDCNLDIQRYDEPSCSCKCSNSDKEEKCHESYDHFWNNDTCKCLCRVDHTCSTGEEFDHTTCQCQPTQENPNFDFFSLRKSPSWEILKARKKPILSTRVNP